MLINVHKLLLVAEQQETPMHQKGILVDLPQVQQHLWLLDYVQLHWELMVEVVYIKLVRPIIVFLLFQDAI